MLITHIGEIHYTLLVFYIRTNSLGFKNITAKLQQLICLLQTLFNYYKAGIAHSHSKWQPRTKTKITVILNLLFCKAAVDIAYYGY